MDKATKCLDVKTGINLSLRHNIKFVRIFYQFLVVLKSLKLEVWS